MVLPVSNTAAPSPANCSWLMRRTERSASRVNSSRPRGPSLAARRVAPFTGGMGDVIASSSGPLTRAEAGVELAPRVAVAGRRTSSSDAAVTSTSVDSAAHRPSVVGCASTIGRVAPPQSVGGEVERSA